MLGGQGDGDNFLTSTLMLSNERSLWYALCDEVTRDMSGIDKTLDDRSWLNFQRIEIDRDWGDTEGFCGGYTSDEAVRSRKRRRYAELIRQLDDTLCQPDIGMTFEWLAGAILVRNLLISASPCKGSSAG